MTVTRSRLVCAVHCGEKCAFTAAAMETLDMPRGVGVSGLESDGGDQFFCGGGKSGKVRAVRRPKRGSAAGSGPAISVDSTNK